MTVKIPYSTALITYIMAAILIIAVLMYVFLKPSKEPEITLKEPLINASIEPSVTEKTKVEIDQSDALRDSIVSYGMNLLGTPYVKASCGIDGFDCSGFVYYVFQHFKIDVPRSSAEFQNFGKTVSIDSAKKGDIIVFLSPTRPVIGHIGIVTLSKGMETEFIHASSGGEMKVIISGLKQIGYQKRFVKVVSVL